MGGLIIDLFVGLIVIAGTTLAISLMAQVRKIKRQERLETRLIDKALAAKEQLAELRMLESLVCKGCEQYEPDVELFDDGKNEWWHRACYKQRNG